MDITHIEINCETNEVYITAKDINPDWEFPYPDKKSELIAALLYPAIQKYMNTDIEQLKQTHIDSMKRGN